ncbi:hypothetical protein BDR05DRAFT_953645 [Suillus weaverae]|nr:hypothetical protein BDR05DRAFT_953645 [Suillus weaverae]
MTFWMPLLFHPQGIQIVVTHLNILSTQNVAALEKLSIKGLALHAETATSANFKAIEDGQYCVVVTNLETLMKANGGSNKLWKNHHFMSQIISIVWDEAHCISKWGDFCPEYKLAGPAVLDDITEMMRLRKNTCIIHHSNDQPNVHLVVREFQYPMSSYLDLAFLVPENVTPDWKPPKFLIFFDDISNMLKFVWFNVEMTPNFREEHTENLKVGTVYGLCCADSFGMYLYIYQYKTLKGIDLPDISLVIQWHMSCDLCTLWQWFGRGARDPSMEAMAFLLIESKYFDRSRQKKADNRDKQEQAKKNTQSKHKAPMSSGLEPPAKRQNQATATGGNEGAMGAVGITDAQMNVGQDQLYESLDVEWVSTYSWRVIKNGQKVKHTGDELGPAEDDFVNAATSSITRLTNTPSHPKLKDYTALPGDMDLRNALHEFHKTQCIEKFGLATPSDLGAGIIMPQQVLQHIVNCAHAGKIKTHGDLIKETRWSGVEEYGEEVLRLVMLHSPSTFIPANPQPQTPLRPHNDFVNATPASHMPVKCQCKVCGSFAHIASNRLCPAKGPVAPACLDKNVPPAV